MRLHAPARARDRRAAAAAARARAPATTSDERGRGRRAQPVPERRALEIFLEPQLPAPRLVVVGDAPVARALAELGRAAGYEVVRGDPRSSTRATTPRVVVASHGRDEERGARRRAGAAASPYVGARRQPTRGAAVRDALDVPRRAAARACTRRPGSTSARARRRRSRSSILAELVAERARSRRCGRGGGDRDRPGLRHGGRGLGRDAAARRRRRDRVLLLRRLPRGYSERTLVTGLVLAAGGSRRLGQPKQLLPYGGATLLDHVLGTARACAFDQLLVRARRRRGRRPRAASTCAVWRSSSTAGFGSGLLVVDRRGAAARSTRARTCSCCCSATSRA